MLRSAHRMGAFEKSHLATEANNKTSDMSKVLTQILASFQFCSQFSDGFPASTLSAAVAMRAAIPK